MSRLRISRLAGERDPDPRGVDLEWEQLAELLSMGATAPCTVETCGAGDNQYAGTKAVKRVCRHKYGAAWTPAVYPKGQRRGKDNVGVVSALVIDLDHMTDDVLDARIDALDGYRYIAHPSHSDGLPPRDKATGEFVTGAAPERAWRVVVALSEPVLGTDWPRFWFTAMHHLGVVDRSQGLDPSTCDASRLYFLPVPRADAPFAETITHDGEPLNVREILAKAPPAAAPRELYTEQHDLPPATPALLERCRERLRDHGPAVEGEGGDRRTFSACAALVHGFGLSYEEAWPLLVEWNKTCVPPWDEDELQTKMENAASYASGPRGAARLEWQAGEDIGDDLLAVSKARKAASAGTAAAYESALEGLWDDLPEPGGAIAHVDDDPDPEPPKPSKPGTAPNTAAVPDHAALAAILAKVAAGPPPEPSREDEPGFMGAHARALREVTETFTVESKDGKVKAKLRDAALFMPAAEMLARPAPATPWLIRGLVKEGGVSMPAAGPKAGKTWFGLECAVAVATGTQAFGSERFKAPRARAVGYFFAEDDQASIAAHLRAFASGRQVPVDDMVRNLWLRPLGEHIDLKRDADVAFIIASAREIPSLGMLVLDPFRNTHSAKESDNDEMAIIMQRLHFISRALGGITVMVPHHSKKITIDEVRAGGAMGGDAIRGASAIFGALDSTIMMARDPDQGDENHIHIMLNAIIKGAKSAGVFALKLTIVDDEHDRAKHAEWEYQSASEKREADALEDVGAADAGDLAVSLVEHMRVIKLRGEQPRDAKKLAREIGWGGTKLTAAISAAQAEGWIHKPKQKWELTRKGETERFDSGVDGE